MTEPVKNQRETQHVSSTCTRDEHIPPMPGTMWLLGKLIAEKIKEKEGEAQK